MMRSWVAVRRCVTFTLWGFTDKYSWVPGFFTGQGEATPLDANFQPKPAYTALQLTLAGATGPRHRPPPPGGDPPPPTARTPLPPKLGAERPSRRRDRRRTRPPRPSPHRRR